MDCTQSLQEALALAEYEDLCRQMGLDPASEEDYERLQDALENGHGVRPLLDRDLDDTTDEIRFSTFREASEWSKRNGGRAFTRSSDGLHFIPAESSDAAQHDGPIRLEVFSFSEGSVRSIEVTQAEIQAYLQGAAAPGSDWLPGTWTEFVAPPELEANEARCRALELKVFMPRLKALAPDIYRNVRRRRYHTVFGFGCLWNRQTAEQLEQLLSLLEGKLTRTRRWYVTQAAANGETRTYEELPSPSLPSGKLREHGAKHGKTPEDLKYWHALVYAVRTEIARRLSK